MLRAVWGLGMQLEQHECTRGLRLSFAVYPPQARPAELKQMSARAGCVSRTGGGFAVHSTSRTRSRPSPFRDVVKPTTPRFLEELLQRQGVFSREELRTPPRFATLPKGTPTYDPGSLFDQEAPPRSILSSQGAAGSIYPSLLEMDVVASKIELTGAINASIFDEQQPRSPVGAHHWKRALRPMEGGLQLLGRECFPSSPRTPQAHSAIGGASASWASGSSWSSPSAGARTPRPPLTPRTQLAVSPLTPRPPMSIVLTTSPASGSAGRASSSSSWRRPAAEAAASGVSPHCAAPARVSIPSVRQARKLASLVPPPQEPRAHPANRDQSAGGDTPPNECATKRVASEAVQSTLHFSTGAVRDERLSRLYSTKAAYRVAAAAPEVVTTGRRAVGRGVGVVY